LRLFYVRTSSRSDTTQILGGRALAVGTIDEMLHFIGSWSETHAGFTEGEHKTKPWYREFEEYSNNMVWGLAGSMAGAPSREYRLFISHAWAYKADYDGVVNLLDTDPTFRWKNLSVPQDNPLPTLFHLPKSNRYLVRQLDERISKADCVLVFAGMYAAHRAWIQSEIEAAQEFNKPIIAIAPRGQARFPDAVMHAAHEKVGWNIASIINAIRKLPVPPDLPTPIGGFTPMAVPGVPILGFKYYDPIERLPLPSTPPQTVPHEYYRGINSVAPSPMTPPSWLNADPASEFSRGLGIAPAPVPRTAPIEPSRYRSARGFLGIRLVNQNK
jgi:hypothetical protein